MSKLPAQHFLKALVAKELLRYHVMKRNMTNRTTVPLPLEKVDMFLWRKA